MNRTPRTRREFLNQVGQGVLIASVGSAVAEGLGISTAFASEGSDRLTFGELEPLVSVMQETPIDRLQPLLVGKLKKGDTTLEKLIRAAELSNARAFGGEDYVGMHTLMALKPAYVMAQQLPSERRALAILKVLYRNTAQIHAKGGREKEVLHPVAPAGTATRDSLRDAVRKMDTQTAEQLFAAAASLSPEKAFNDLLHVIADSTDVHRTVLAHRSWDTLDLVGMEHAHTLLRQSLRFCLRNEKWSAKAPARQSQILPKLIDEYKLLGRPPGKRTPDDAWVDNMSQTIFKSTRDQAAEAVAASLAEGISPAAIGEAISLAANQLVLRDIGRTEKNKRPGKPVGSVHGDSIGVHASDSANAWRSMATVSNPRNAAACLILGAFQAAHDRTNRGGKFLDWKPRPHEEHLSKIKAEDAETLLKNLDGAIREQDQAMACAITHRYGELGRNERPALDVLLRYSTSEDGALHAEKYYLTTTSDFAITRKPFRWRHLAGLARVTASEFGTRAAGYDEACELLGVEA